MDPTVRFAELLNRPSAEVHLDVMAGLIGAAFDPVADLDAMVSDLDDLALRCRPSFRSILHELFVLGRLRGNTADYGDPRNSYLHHVLQRGVGIPITLSICAMEVGRRLGVEVHGIGLPGHFLVESDGLYADPFHSGRTCDQTELETVWHRLTGLTEPLEPAMLRPASDRLVLLRMLNNLKNTFVAMDDPVPLRVLAGLREAFPELAAERTEHARWMRHWN